MCGAISALCTGAVPSIRSARGSPAVRQIRASPAGDVPGPVRAPPEALRHAGDLLHVAGMPGGPPQVKVTGGLGEQQVKVGWVNTALSNLRFCGWSLRKSLSRLR